MASGAAPIENWSDSEIRTKLAELGTPVGPVTETTRKILIKKLKRLLQLQNNNASSPSKQRRSLARYSSGEDSQGEGADMPPPSTKLKNVRRKTIGYTELLANSPDTSVSTSVPISERTTRGRKSLGNTPVTKTDLLDTDSDSDLLQPLSSSRLRKSRNFESTSDILPLKDRKSVDDKKDYSTTWRSFHKTTEDQSSKNDLFEPKSNVEEFEETYETDEEGEDDDDNDVMEEEEVSKPPVFQSNFLSRLSSSGNLPKSYGTPSNLKSYSKPITSPNLSSTITQRYSRLDNKLLSPNYDLKNTYISRLGSGGFAGFFSRQASTSKSLDPKARMGSLLTKNNNSLKMLLVCAGVLILVSVGFFLLFANTRVHLQENVSQDNYPICGKNGIDPEICVAQSFLDQSYSSKVIEFLRGKVLNFTIERYCDSSDDSIEVPILNQNDLIKYLAMEMPSISRPELEEILKSFKVLVTANPRWAITFISKGTQPVNPLSYGDFAAQHVDLPLGCYLRLLGYKLFKLLLCVTILIGSGFGLLFGAKLYKQRKANHKQEVFHMVNKILNLLSAHHEQNVLPAYLAVNNCRDELIPPSERDKKKSVWNDAVEFLETKESRVRTEVHSIRGENVKVWRWLPAGGPPSSPKITHDNSSGPVLGRLM